MPDTGMPDGAETGNLHRHCDHCWCFHELELHDGWICKDVTDAVLIIAIDIKQAWKVSDVIGADYPLVTWFGSIWPSG